MKRKWGVAALVVVAAGTLAGGVYLTWLRSPPPMPGTIEQAVAVMSSSRYQRLSEPERQPYIERARQLGEGLTPEQRRALWDKAKDDPSFRSNARQVQSDMMLDRAREFATADPAKRRDILDKLIAMQELMSRGAATRPASSGGGPGGGHPETGASRAERMKWVQNMVEHGNPQKQAYMSEFFKALAQRRKELGLSPMPSPPR